MWERKSPHTKGQQTSVCCIPESTAPESVEEQKEHLTSHTGTHASLWPLNLYWTQTSFAHLFTIDLFELCCTVHSRYSRYLTQRISVCAQVSVGAEGSTMSGSLQRRKKSKRKWKRLWFLLKDKVLYTFKAREVRGPWVSHTSTNTILHKLILYIYNTCTHM